MGIYFPNSSDDKRICLQCKRPNVRETCNVRSVGQEDPLEKGVANPLQYSRLENSTHKGAWWATYSPWGRKELNTTEQLTLSLFSYICILNAEVKSKKFYNTHRILGCFLMLS